MRNPHPPLKVSLVVVSPVDFSQLIPILCFLCKLQLRIKYALYYLWWTVINYFVTFLNVRERNYKICRPCKDIPAMWRYFKIFHSLD